MRDHMSRGGGGRGRGQGMASIASPYCTIYSDSIGKPQYLPVILLKGAQAQVINQVVKLEGSGIFYI